MAGCKEPKRFSASKSKKRFKLGTRQSGAGAPARRLVPDLFSGEHSMTYSMNGPSEAPRHKDDTQCTE